ncbi:MAG: potassium channel family protein [Actinomycetota bacterium]|nr:potassium channel family protein [Actinomycetota bacterium]
MESEAQAGGGFRYGWLLGLIATSLMFQLAAPDTALSRLVTVGLQSATLILALWTSQARPAIRRLAALAVVVAVLGSVSAAITGGNTGKAGIAIVNLFLVALAPVAVAAGVTRSVREYGGVTLATMFGVLCIYLLLGMLFSFGYAVIDGLGSDSVFAQTSDPDQADFLYFSYATLTTTGFGDLTASGGISRAVTTIEALIGQIYLVTVVAAIVSNMRPRRG